MVTFSVNQFLTLLFISYLSFSLLFFGISSISPENGVINETGTAISLGESFYFSLCTITRSCIGDYSVNRFSKLLITFEVLAGLVLFGMFLSKLVGAKSSKMTEKMYEGQYRQKLREYRNSWAEQRAGFIKLSKKALEPGNILEVKKEIAQHIKNKTSENYLKIISSKMSACSLFLYHNYMVSFLDKKFDEEVLSALLHSLKITLLQISKGIKRFERSSQPWLNYYSKENLNNITAYSQTITKLIEKRLSEPKPENAVKDIELIRTECEKISRRISAEKSISTKVS
ncbi:MAG: hypothetical protein QT03_C0001G0005 [archaeon GW2011_AR10]|nr:MAG: hypothetical protein QT03_C0001G0005 [archaeon GW2011_AR10]